MRNETLADAIDWKTYQVVRGWPAGMFRSASVLPGTAARSVS